MALRVVFLLSGGGRPMSLTLNKLADCNTPCAITIEPSVRSPLYVWAVVILMEIEAVRSSRCQMPSLGCVSIPTRT